MKAIGRKAVFIYSGLDVILQITSVDPLEQIYYAGSDSFIPDRTLTPLVLTARAQVRDKKGISMPSELANVAWYVGAIDEKNRVTSRTQTDDYYLDGLNLVVRKNLEVPQQIYVKAEYLDTRTKTTITIPQVAQLSISKSSEVAPAPTCSIDRPSDWSINPLKDAAIQDLSATIFKDEKAYRGAVKWNKSFNGIKSEIVEEDDFYISGQLTNSLKIDTDKLPSGVLIGCENPSEEIYNKAYGVNPEWDNRMKEVFENRNLLVSPIWMMGGINGDGSNKDDSNATRTTFISVKPKSKYSCKLFGEIPTRGWGVNFYKEKNDHSISSKQLWSFKSNISQFETNDETNFIRLNKISTTLNDRAKLERGDKSTPYTPAPEDLNWENYLFGYYNAVWATDSTAETTKLEDGVIKVNGLISKTDYYAYFFYKGLRSKNFKNGENYIFSYDVFIPLDSKTNIITTIIHDVTSSSGAIYNIRDEDRGKWVTISCVKINFQQATDRPYWYSRAEASTGISYFMIKNYRINKLVNTDFIPSYNLAPEDYAPDGIVKGEYEADVPMFVKYPDTLDISMKPLPLIPEGVEELELEVEATTSAGTLNNPAKYFDIDYYLANDEEAGVEPVKVGSGNSVKVTRNQLKERPEYYLEWDYKPRPTSLNKKQSQSMDK